MAVYRVTLDLFFDSLTDVQAFRNEIIKVLPKVRNVISENSRAVVHICHHDETPPMPCTEKIYEWEKTV